MWKKDKIQPFAGVPQTKLYRNKDGDPKFEVTIKELTPKGAKFADVFSSLTTWTGLGLTLKQATELPDPNWAVWAGAIAIPFVFKPLVKMMAKEQFKKTTKVSFTETAFTMPGFLKNTEFNRNLEHSFLLIPHDKKEIEQEKHELEKIRARQRGKLLRPTKYYGDSYHLVYAHLGERFDITDIYGEKEAKRALDRLVTIDSVIDAITNAGPGTPMNPTDEWNPQAGNLPK